MARKLVGLAVVLMLSGGCICVREVERVEGGSAPACAGSVEAKTPARVLRHVVLFQFKEGTGAEEIREIENAFSALPSKIDVIYDFEWGTDVSVENRQKGFTHCFVVTFLSEADRDTYAKHPAHQEFGASIQPYVGDVLVIDYWAK